MRYKLIIPTIGMLLIAGCNRKVEDAQRRYELVKHSRAHADEICAAGINLVQAYLEANDAKSYRHQQLISSVDCSSAMLDERNGRYRDSNGNLMEPMTVEETDRLAGIASPPQEPKPDGPASSTQKPGDPCYNVGPDC